MKVKKKKNRSLKIQSLSVLTRQHKQEKKTKKKAAKKN